MHFISSRTLSALMATGWTADAMGSSAGSKGDAGLPNSFQSKSSEKKSPI